MGSSSAKTPPDPTGMNPFVSVDDAGYRGISMKGISVPGPSLL